MGLDVAIYKRNIKANVSSEEIGQWLYEFRNSHELVDYLFQLDNSNYFNSLGISIFRLDAQKMPLFKDWLIENRVLNWQYDECLSRIENEKSLFIYANW